MLAYIHHNNHYRAPQAWWKHVQASACLLLIKLELPVPPRWSSVETHQASETTILAVVYMIDGKSVCIGDAMGDGRTWWMRRIGGGVVEVSGDDGWRCSSAGSASHARVPSLANAQKVRLPGSHNHDFELFPRTPSNPPTPYTSEQSSVCVAYCPHTSFESYQCLGSPYGRASAVISDETTTSTTQPLQWPKTIAPRGHRLTRPSPRRSWTSFNRPYVASSTNCQLGQH